MTLTTHCLSYNGDILPGLIFPWLIRTYLSLSVLLCSWIRPRAWRISCCTMPLTSHPRPILISCLPPTIPSCEEHLVYYCKKWYHSVLRLLLCLPIAWCKLLHLLRATLTLARASEVSLHTCSASQQHQFLKYKSQSICMPMCSKNVSFSFTVINFLFIWYFRCGCMHNNNCIKFLIEYHYDNITSKCPWEVKYYNSLLRPEWALTWDFKLHA